MSRVRPPVSASDRPAWVWTGRALLGESGELRESALAANLGEPNPAAPSLPPRGPLLGEREKPPLLVRRDCSTCRERKGRGDGWGRGDGSTRTRRGRARRRHGHARGQRWRTAATEPPCPSIDSGFGACRSGSLASRRAMLACDRPAKGQSVASPSRPLCCQIQQYCCCRRDPASSTAPPYRPRVRPRGVSLACLPALAGHERCEGSCNPRPVHLPSVTVRSPAAPTPSDASCSGPRPGSGHAQQPRRAAWPASLLRYRDLLQMNQG